MLSDRDEAEGGGSGQKQVACERFLRWLDWRLLAEARGDDCPSLDVEPSGRFWLGRLAPESEVRAEGAPDREQRLDPCAVGIRVRLDNESLPSTFGARVRARVWDRVQGARTWEKSSELEITVQLALPDSEGTHALAQEELESGLYRLTGQKGRRARLDVEREQSPRGLECIVTLVNASDRSSSEIRDPNLYQAQLEVWGISTVPYELEALPDSFRYDRTVAAYGINCGVRHSQGVFCTTDTIMTETPRPRFWNVNDNPPDLRFERLATTPLEPLEHLVQAYRNWGNEVWSEAAIRQRSGGRAQVSQEMRTAAAEYRSEIERLADGLELLREDNATLRAFCLMNRAMQHASHGTYTEWRPFQIGFILSALHTVRREHESRFADVLWLPTASGKTETYLGLLVLAALYDRMTGKSTGVTAWTRFPLRMLSLQQTQRFADALAGADIARQEAEIPGDPISLGFLVGQAATPNEIDPEAPEHSSSNPDDPNMPARYQVLLRCPFCNGEAIRMEFDRRQWRLEHVCGNSDCAYADRPLPFYLVDQEIYRFLPTVVVGTLDKAASISSQAAMRGLVGPPLGRCSEPSHGYTYAARSKRPTGCLVPGCRGTRNRLPIPGSVYGPTYRLQDELHLLRDSLGAVDAHYEALLDHLQSELTGRAPHILASSATLSGHENQVRVLYRRDSRVFPAQGPSASEGFWTAPTERVQRRFVAVAPRGVTLEFATDRTMTELQRQVRRLIDEPATVCQEAGIDPALSSFLLDVYGTDVIYGNTIRDLEAVIRSTETQVPVAPLNTAALTGRTPFSEVRSTLDRLDTPERDFYERVHMVAASSMMSHGVDINRLNAMVMLGVPLTTAEFIQSTARIGRRWPGLVHVLHKIGRERDAGIYRSFPKFVEQGDRFVEPIPITRRSRRVLERTIAGLILGRLLAIHEPQAHSSLTTVGRLRQYVESGGFVAEEEIESVIRLLAIETQLEAGLREYIRWWILTYHRAAQFPTGPAKFPGQLSPSGEPMRSLRDVEAQAPIRD